MIGAIACLFSHLTTTYLAPTTALNHVIEVASSSWIQEHTADIAQSVCSMFPPLTSYLLPRVNPMALLSIMGFGGIFLMDVIIEIK